MSNVYKWVGDDGDYIPGVPTRELTEDEAKEFGVTENPLYKRVKAKDAPKAQADADGGRS
jgi:hypothetical protein